MCVCFLCLMLMFEMNFEARFRLTYKHPMYLHRSIVRPLRLSFSSICVTLSGSKEGWMFTSFRVETLSRWKVVHRLAKSFKRYGFAAMTIHCRSDVCCVLTSGYRAEAPSKCRR